jgi:hypothetical protein
MQVCYLNIKCNSCMIIMAGWNSEQEMTGWNLEQRTQGDHPNGEDVGLPPVCHNNVAPNKNNQSER